MIESQNIDRLRIRVNGIVQGVGFRPYVYNLANSLGSNGFITNDSHGVLIELQGTSGNLKRFIKSLKVQAPPLARITDIQIDNIPIIDSEDSFKILDSIQGEDNQTMISPDIAVCNDCLYELFDPGDRRYLYPFINCTNCGPRFTIIKGIPYDRPETTMAAFTMCKSCQQEYDNPSNRRFHAQPNACPECGPQVWYETYGNIETKSRGPDAISKAIDDIIDGKIVVIKGLGGFHLACDAANEDAVGLLRLRKYREEKPLAIMLESIADAIKIAHLNQYEQQLIQSFTRPIVLVKKKDHGAVADNVAPGNQRLGIMLPYTPLHFIIFKQLRQHMPSGSLPVLVMTSANLSEEPIAIDNGEARVRLQGIADSFLMHNRDILIRSDDSVILSVNDKEYFFRRSRGYVPKPVFIKNDGIPVLGVGGELKNTICLLKNDRMFVSQHIGDLENLAAHQFFEETNKHLREILRVEPELIVCDMHPGYFSTQWALKQPYNTIKIQHHHAHLSACLAEHQHDGPVIGIILDGTGYGYDGKIWGGEILIADYTNIQRFAHLEYLPLPGGDAAIKEPWRIAIGYLAFLFDDQIPDLPPFSEYQSDVIRQMVQKDINCVMTSSCGRLFDAVAAIAGGKTVIRYEAQAAIELMQAVENLDEKPFEYLIDIPAIPLKPIIISILKALNKGENFSKIAARFHCTLVQLFTEVVKKASADTGIKTVALSGGVMQNEILLRGLIVSLEKAGFSVLYNQQVPANDGGISLGQAAIGRMLHQKGMKKPEFKY